MKPVRTCLLLLALGACTSTTAPPPVTTAPADTGAAWYQSAAQAGAKVYRIDSALSLITVTVRRGGALARFGHDHVVATRDVKGLVAPDAGRADFHFRLDAMSVDQPELRVAAGLDTQPSAEAIAGTRTNMLTRVLEAERFPLVMLRVERLPGAADKVRLEVTLHGVTRTAEVPVHIERGKTSISASGQLTLKQTDFGITPMSVMAGAMVVQDQMELKFKIVAGTAR